MTTTASTTVFIGDPYHGRSPQRTVLSTKIGVEPSFVSWRKHQKAHSSISLNSAYGRRHSLESLSGGSLRNATIGIRTLRWRLQPQHPLIEKLSGIAHFHYDLVELGPIKVELLPPGSNADLNNSTSSNRRSYLHHNHHHQSLASPGILPVLREHCVGSIQQDSSRISPGGEETALSYASASPLPSPWLKESNSRVDADVFHQERSSGGGDCVTISTGSKPSWPTKILYTLRVHSNQQTWAIQRTYEDFVDFDKQLHRCVYDRRISLLNELPTRANTVFVSPFNTMAENSALTDDAIWAMLSRYMERFSDLAGSLITCFPVLKWLELDNRGNHLVAAEETEINTPAIGAAYVVQNYTASATDELTLKVGDIVSVIDMPPASESIWWRGKLTILKTQYADVNINGGEKQHQHTNKFDTQPMSPEAHFTIQVGFFPSHCVQLFGNRLGSILPGALRENNAALSRPVFRRRGKWATLLRLFLANRPSRRILKEAGILKERVFGCDLAEHLESTSLDIPVVLRSCSTVIETSGIVDGIYRGSGVVSNIQRLRNAFDENRVPNLATEDVYCIASLLKMYFRELPNPLLTYQLYGSFMKAVDGDDSSMKILRLHDVVQQLPPPYFRTAEYLIKHLANVGEHGHKTGMHYPNLSLVWAPNLLRCKELENVKENTGTVLRNVNTQAVVVEYLIRYADIIFSRKMPMFATPIDGGVKRRPRPVSLACPSSLSSSPSKLINLEEAKRKLTECKNEKVPSNVGLPDLSNRKCIDVNGGPSNIPPKYHTVIQLPTSKSLTRMAKAGSGAAGIGSWRLLFHGRKSTHETVAEHQPSSPQISSPQLIYRPITHADFDGNEKENNKQSRLRHVRSAENFHATPAGQGRFVSLDPSIRQLSSARRSVRVPKPTASGSTRRTTTSPPDSGRVFVYPDVFTQSASTPADNIRSSLKPCKTTNIDDALNTVMASNGTTPIVLPLNYNDGVQETIPIMTTSYFETSIMPPPLSPVSEPPASVESVSDDGEWIRNLLGSNFAAIDDSFHEEIDVPMAPMSMAGRKAYSAPNSLRRPGEKKYPTAASICESNCAISNGTGLLNSVDGKQSASPQPPRSPTVKVVTFSPELEKKLSVESLNLLPIAPTPPVEEASGITAAGQGKLSNGLSQNEEKFLLAELSKTPPENSPSHEDLQNLFPGLTTIYSSLEEIPAVVSAIELDDEENMKDEKADSITDLDVLEPNPNWTGPPVEDVKGKPNGSNDIVDKTATSLLVPAVESIRGGKQLKDAATSPLPEVSAIPTSDVRPLDHPKFITALNHEMKGMLAEPQVQSQIIKSEITPGQKVAQPPKFISFKEANALSDRLETWQAVKSGRYDSEDEDPSCLESIYDNVVESPTKTQPAMEPKNKPTPKPRISKMKSAQGQSVDGMPIMEKEVEPERAIATIAIRPSKPQRPVALTVISLEQKNWSSSEESELANSPLFRKQQQQLFTPAPSEERNKSEPPCTDSVHSRLDQRTMSEMDGDSSISAKSETQLHRSKSSVEERRGSHRVIAPSPRSAFSPVVPKLHLERDHDSSSPASATNMDPIRPDDSSQSQPLQVQPLHSILSKKSPSLKSKNTHVYFV